MQNPLINNNPFLDDEFEVQSIDGTDNNLENPEYGAAETSLEGVYKINLKQSKNGFFELIDLTLNESWQRIS
ncbi:MAG: hypothetical protein AAF063_23425 [Cyanobacteria bacterium J06643_5]